MTQLCRIDGRLWEPITQESSIHSFYITISVIMGFIFIFDAALAAYAIFKSSGTVSKSLSEVSGVRA